MQDVTLFDVVEAFLASFGLFCILLMIALPLVDLWAKHQNKRRGMK